MSVPVFKRLVRFIPRSNPSRILLGEPVSDSLDVGLSLRKGQEVSVYVWSGASVLSPGVKTGQCEIIDRLLSPIAPSEVGTVRCIGLNYIQHATELKMEIPTLPTVFMKPSTSIGDPWPAPTFLPKLSQCDNSADFESELAIIIGRTCKNVSKDEAGDFILGYTGCNDVSSRASQFAQSQWCFSKGFDTSCPLGPTLVSTKVISDVQGLRIRGLKNGAVMQDCGIDDLIFGIGELVSFLSQDTTLPAGTVIITGTPAGVGVGRSPKETVQDGDEFSVEILPHIGTLVNVFKNA